MSIGQKAPSGSVLSKDDKKLRQGYVNLVTATTVELEELIERQEKLLRNRVFLSKLPDKGKKIISFKEQLQNELTKRQEMLDSACDQLSKLKLTDPYTENYEWNNGKVSSSKKQLDSDDDEDTDDEEYFSASETDPLKILATHSGTSDSIQKKIVIHSSALSNDTKVDYVNKMCLKYDGTAKPKDRFKPNQLKESRRDLVQSSAIKVKQRLGEKWEVTEATPPIFKIQSTKPISLMESIQLQREHADKLKDTEKKLATEKLLLNMNIKMGNKMPLNNLNEYRSNRQQDSYGSEEEEEEEEKDDDDYYDGNKEENAKYITQSDEE